MRKKQTVGAVLIVKNEEVLIERCIRSLAGLDEIVVLDTGSKDRTLDILLDLQREIPLLLVFTDYSWCDDFSAARNYALAACGTDWALSIDADEYLPADGVTKIREAVSLCPEANDGIFCRMDYGGSVHHVVRLFRNIPTVRWTGRVHELPTASSPIWFPESHLPVINVEYSPSHQHDPERNIRILRQESDSSTRACYYLGNAYFDAGRYDEAIPVYKQYLASSCAFQAQRADAWYRLGAIAFRQNDWNLARDHLQKCLGLSPSFRAAADLMGGICYEPWKYRYHLQRDLSNNHGVLFSRPDTGHRLDVSILVFAAGIPAGDLREFLINKNTMTEDRPKCEIVVFDPFARGDIQSVLQDASSRVRDEGIKLRYATGDGVMDWHAPVAEGTLRGRYTVVQDPTLAIDWKTIDNAVELLDNTRNLMYVSSSGGDLFQVFRTLIVERLPQSCLRVLNQAVTDFNHRLSNLGLR